MKDKVAPIVAVVLVGIVAIAIYTTSEGLQSPEVRLDRQVREHIERAERLLSAYSQEAVRAGELLQQTAELVAPADAAGAAGLPAAQLAELEAEPEFQTKLNDSLGQLFGEPTARKLVRELETDFQSQLSSAEQDATAGDVPQPRVSLAAAQNELNAMFDENRARLDAAWAAIQEGLNTSVDSASGRDHAGVNRMAGIVQYHLGAEALRQARATRLRAAAPRRRIATLARLHKRAQNDARHFNSRKVADVVAQIEMARAERQKELEQKRSALQAEQTAIEQLNQQLAEARQVSEAAGAKLARLEAAGYPTGGAAAFDAYRQAFLDAGKEVSAADSAAATIELGGLLNARISDPDKLLTDPYEGRAGQPITAFKGIAQRRHQVELLTAEVADLAGQVEQLGEHIGKLGELDAGLGRRRAAADARADVLGSRIREELSALTTILASAEEIEERVLDRHADQASGFFRTAARIAQTTATDARTAAMDAPPESPNERLELIQKDTDFAGHLNASAADAQLLTAMVYYQRWIDLRQQRRTVQLAQATGVADADPAALDEGIRQAVESGLAAAGEAAEQLERAQNNVGGHWTVVGARATALYLGAQFGRVEDQNLAAEALQSIIDQPNDPMLQPYVNLLNHIQSVAAAR